MATDSITHTVKQGYDFDEKFCIPC